VNQDATDALLDLLNRVASAERDLIDGIDEAAAVAETVLEVHGAAVMLLNRDGDFGLVGASNPYAAALERAQIEAGDGPCMECTRRGAVVAVDDLTEAPRWQGLAGPHVRAVHAKDMTITSALTLDMPERRPGLGGIDYRAFITQMQRLDPDTPFLVEHLPSDEEYVLAVAHVRAVADELGVAT